MADRRACRPGALFRFGRVGPLGLAAVAALTLGACVPEVVPDRNVCGAAGMQDLLGQDRSVLAAMTLPAGTRVITPGMAITEDYSARRLNIDIGADGRIQRLWCG